MKWKYILAWFPSIIIAIANGSLRQFIYRIYFDELPAHQLSAVSFILLFGIYVWFVISRLRVASGSEAVRIGLIWLFLTIAFEFVFGHYVMGHPWQKLFYDYNIPEGQLWIIVLFWIALSPFALYRLRIYRLKPAD